MTKVSGKAYLPGDVSMCRKEGGDSSRGLGGSVLSRANSSAKTLRWEHPVRVHKSSLVEQPQEEGRVGGPGGEGQLSRLWEPCRGLGAKEQCGVI